MTIEQLKEVMKFQLQNFSKDDIVINDDTIHGDVLSDDDGFGHVNPVKIYRDAIRFTLKKEGHELKKWPDQWLKLSLHDLAIQII